MFGHDGLAVASMENPVSARMRDVLFNIAQQRLGEASAIDKDERRCIVLMCHDSIPKDILSRIAPEFFPSVLL